MVIAELQHITYKEFLPIVLNNDIMRRFNLRIYKPAHDNVYNSSTDPRIINAFATAVFRFGHTLVRQIVGTDNGNSIFVDSLFKHFDRPRMTLSSNGYGHEYMANWKSRTGTSQPDGFIVDAIRNRLFESESEMASGATKSFDLAALNIQRGRDHGLPGYTVYREWCGLSPVRHFGTWNLGLVDHDSRAAANLRSIYRSENFKFRRKLFFTKIFKREFISLMFCLDTRMILTSLREVYQREGFQVLCWVLPFPAYLLSSSKF